MVAGTGIEVLSDLFFHLGGVTPPKVRRSKLKEDSDLERLSLRDLLWYCYLDQDTIDNEFFHLDACLGTGDTWLLSCAMIIDVPVAVPVLFMLGGNRAPALPAPPRR